MNRPDETARNHEKEAAADRASRAVPCAVLTISDTRSLEEDTSGARIVAALEAAGHAVVRRDLVRDEPEEIAARLRAWCDDEGVRAVITTGGTGLGLRDTTVEVVRGLLQVEIDGFGELFRMLSYEEIGAASMLSRAVAGIAPGPTPAGVYIFALPGSTGAVTLAMDALIIPQLPHLVWQRG